MSDAGEPKPITAVIGAGGGTGLECVKRLLEATDHDIRAIVREPEKYQDVIPKDERVVVLPADVCKAHTIRETLAGCDGVIFAASAASFWSPESVDFKGVGAVARAAEELGLKRVVLVSSMLVSPHNRWHPMRIVLNNVKNSLMDFKFQGEGELRKCKASYTIVRPGGLTKLPGGQKLFKTGQGDRGAVSGSISRADVAAVCVEALSNPAADRVTVEVVSGDPLPEGKDFADAVKEMWSGLKPDTEA